MSSAPSGSRSRACWRPSPSIGSIAPTRASPIPAIAGTFVLTGEQRSKGIELGLERSISDNWQISAGYAWQKAEITERTTACDPARR